MSRTTSATSPGSASSTRDARTSGGSGSGRRTASPSPGHGSGVRRRSGTRSIRDIAAARSTTSCSTGSRPRPKGGAARARRSRRTRNASRSCVPAATRSSPPPACSRTTSASWAISPTRSLPDGLPAAHGRARRPRGARRAASGRLGAFAGHGGELLELQTVWPYRADLDCVVEAPDGSLVAYCLAWLDDANRVGELEPVGTHPDYRRRGLAVSRVPVRAPSAEGRGSDARHRLLDRGLGGDGAVRVDRPAPAHALAPAPEAAVGSDRDGRSGGTAAGGVCRAR